MGAYRCTLSPSAAHCQVRADFVCLACCSCLTALPQPLRQDAVAILGKVYESYLQTLPWIGDLDSGSSLSIWQTTVSSMLYGVCRQLAHFFPDQKMLRVCL